MEEGGNNLKAFILATALALTSVGHTQIVINSDITDASANFSYLSDDAFVALPSGTLEFFWFTAANIPTIQTWTKVSDWLTSALYSNKLGQLSIGTGYDGAPGLFAGQISVASLVSGAVGQNLAIAVTSGTSLGVFQFQGVLPANQAVGSPTVPDFNVSLADVNLGGVLVGLFKADGSFGFGGNTFSGEAYALIPEPSTGSLIMIGAAGLVALRRLRKV